MVLLPPGVATVSEVFVPLYLQKITVILKKKNVGACAVFWIPASSQVTDSDSATFVSAKML